VVPTAATCGARVFSKSRLGREQRNSPHREVELSQFAPSRMTFRRLEQRRLAAVAGYDDVRRLSRLKLPRAVFDTIDGAAGAEATLRRNREAFERVELQPRVLTDVATRETTTTVFGHKIAVPVMLSPAGGSRMAHREGERDAARAAGDAGTIFCVPTASNYALEEIVEVAQGPLWFQVFPWGDDRLLELVRRVKAANCAALVVTIDCPVLGNHEREVRHGASVPPRFTVRNALGAARHPKWAAEFLRGGMLHYRTIESQSTWSRTSVHQWASPSATWERIDRLRELWEGPLVLKGVITADAALEAVSRGVDGIYVSNHGGRQLDGAPPSIDVLSEIVEAIDGRAEVFLDSGVRRGQDVVKARALGARACFVGRPWVHSLAAGGAAGIRRYLELVQADVDRTLALVGVAKFDDLTSAVLRSPG
jgi:isopentenyl diphosphate isomerase/L-lactate dehydrogenase-like FMN-dependent dehydrogenase